MAGPISVPDKPQVVRFLFKLLVLLVALALAAGAAAWWWTTQPMALAAPKVAAPKQADPDVNQLERELSERLAASVAIKHKRGGKGQLVIRYASLDELDGILARIK